MWLTLWFIPADLPANVAPVSLYCYVRYETTLRQQTLEQIISQSTCQFQTPGLEDNTKANNVRQQREPKDELQETN